MDDQRADREGGLRTKRLSLKDLLESIAAVAAGLGMIAFALRGNFRLDLLPYYSSHTYLILVVGAMCVGVGLLNPINRTRLGAVLGFIAMVTLLAISYRL